MLNDFVEFIKYEKVHMYLSFKSIRTKKKLP